MTDTVHTMVRRVEALYGPLDISQRRILTQAFTNSSAFRMRAERNRKAHPYRIRRHWGPSRLAARRDRIKQPCDPAATTHFLDHIKAKEEDQ